MQGDFSDWFAWFGGDDFPISLLLIWRQGSEDGIEHGEEQLRQETGDVGVETV